MEKDILKFPEGFLWGSGTSAHQVEGGCNNDWTEWEQANAERLARQAKDYWQDWQQKKFPEMFLPENYISGRACDHYNRYEEDFDLAKSLGQNAHRFSIEWSRVEPEEGKFDEREIEHYRQVVLALKKRELMPIVTLWHWTMPTWLTVIGGWENKKTVGYYLRYLALIVKELGGDVEYWAPLNEPLMHIGHGYIDAKFPPNKKFNPIRIIKVFANLVEAHSKGYDIIHLQNSGAKVSVAMTTGYFEPARRWNLIEVLIARLGHYFRNDWFLKRIKNKFDFIGVNYYHHDRMIWYPPFRKNLDEEVTDRGWEIFPEGIYHVLKNYKKYKKPLIILENGLADSNDNKRTKFILDHLKNVHRAINEGANVRGYIHWSLLDNFEWAEGFWPRFGLVEVDYKTLARKIRPSAYVFSEICKNNQLEIPASTRGESTRGGQNLK